MDYMNVIASAKPNLDKLPGGWEPNQDTTPVIGSTDIHFVHKSAICNILGNVIGKGDCEALANWMLQAPKLEGVTVQGKDLTVNDDIGSMRATIWSPNLAVQLWDKVKTFVPNECMHDYKATDWWQGDKNRILWKPIGFSPMMRFMRYEKGGEHWSHYDAAFIYPNDKYRTLKSVVIYLTTSEIGGSTRFIKDGQDQLPVWERSHDDWLRPAREDEVIFKSPSIQGNMLVFDHRICHDVERFGDTGKSRIIIRTDILYEAVQQ